MKQLAVLLAVLMLIVRRKLILYKKEQRFYSRNRNDAIAWIFSDAALLLNQMGYDRHSGSMLSLCEPVTVCFGEEYGQQLQKMIELNGQALFSSHVLGRDDWKQVMEFHSRTLSGLKGKTGIGKRLWLKWIRCLY